MSLPDIDFSKIRLHRGSQDSAFEELCCQLAALEPLPTGARHYRKGPGADAGVECFTIRADGSEVGWQVKYYKRMDSSLLTSLDDSIGTALKKHPNLVEYVVCVPFDLSDGRKGDQETALARWETWRTEWINKCMAEGRAIEIVFWGSSTLKRLLTTDDPARVGRVLFWFDTELLTHAWFRSKFERTRADLGRRYTAETNVALPIRRILLGMARDPFLTEQVGDWCATLSQRARLVLAAVGASAAGAVRELSASLEAVMKAFAQPPSGPDAHYPVAEWSQLVDEAHEHVLAEVGRLWTCRDSSTRTGPSRQALHELSEVLATIRDELGSDLWRLANATRLLVHGDAGRGKSHLLADACSYEVERGRPALMLLGSKFNDAEPWNQVIRELDLPVHVQAKTFLGALDAAAQAAGARALILIDALNERNGSDIWPSRLAGLFHDARAFPHVAIVVSCRTTYLNTVIPDSLPAEELPRVEHRGFDASDARAYLMMRSVVLPSQPYPAEEFRNPLFLKSCCDSFEKQGLQAFPRGMSGVTAIFDLYAAAVTQAINLRLKLARGRQFVERTLKALADQMAMTGHSEIARDQAYDLVDTIYPGDGTLERDLLFQLESEGVVAFEPIITTDGTPGEVLRFTFERFSDHVIARGILEESLNGRDIRTAFDDDTPFRRMMTRDDIVIGPGVLEALAVQLPERYGIEITAFPVDPWRRIFIEDAFKTSLLMRNQAYFTEDTLKTVEQLDDAGLVLDTLIAVATEPENRYNARFLHDRLAAQTMPERDADWSIHVATVGEAEGGPIETLIDWALEAGNDFIDQERAELAGIILAWFLTTTNRVVRDRATKTLAALMTPRPEIARSIVRRFAAIDDLYLVERMVAAVYGAALQGKWIDEALQQVVTEISTAFFAVGGPPANALLRDHARSLIEYASVRGCLPADFDLSLMHPPYHSAWPIEHVSDETIAGYTRTYDSGWVGPDEIVSSCVRDGDFARYVLDYVVDGFSPALRETGVLPTTQDLGEQWLADFRAVATPEMLAAYNSLMATLQQAGPHPTWHGPEAEAIKIATEAFRAAVGETLYEDYRARAENWRAGGMYQIRARSGPAHFNLAWARRWVCKRAHDLGWSEDRHGQFDRGQRSGRNDHRIERIGKKYQWLALYELRARMEDNLAPVTDDTAAEVKDGVEDRLRNIDPSLLIRSTLDVGWGQPSRATFWIPKIPRTAVRSTQEALLWRDSERDILDGPEFIDLLDPNTGRRWLALHGFHLWQLPQSSRSPAGVVRETWCRITAILVRQEDEDRLVEALADRRLTDSHCLPIAEGGGTRRYLGEYPWRRNGAGDVEWSTQWGAVWSEEDKEWREPGVSVRATTTEYRCERGNYDHSIDETVTVRLPAPWILQSLGLRLVDGREPAFADASGVIRFFDPSTRDRGTSAALIDREHFLALLHREGLAALWVVAGEKSLYTQHGGEGFGGRAIFTSIYRIIDGQLKQAHRYTGRDEPSQKQLRMLLEQ
ncbi:hypothetical protein [Microvirga sp. TS319]|uniref:hypothetical protein n=1 Tax=Microvirga sp. TS319 TaxID=3241165 RepID=UPI00351AA92E